MSHTPRSAAPWGAILSLVSALLYGMSPIDLIPDIIPLLGWVDDAFIVPILIIYAIVQFRRAKREPARVSYQPPAPPKTTWRQR